MDEQARQSAASLAIPTEPPHVRVEMFSQPRYLSGARDLVSAVARRFGFDESACGQIALAVDEALCNIIRHGYDRRTDGRIWIMLWPSGRVKTGAGADPADPLANEAAGDGTSGRGCGCSGASKAEAGAGLRSNGDGEGEPGGILIAIEDEAKQVDLSQIRSRDLEDIRPGGLGVFIIQSVMDAVAYQHRAEGGMRLLMSKRVDVEALRRQQLEHPEIEIADANGHHGGGHHATDDRSDPEGSRGHADGAAAGQERP